MEFIAYLAREWHVIEQAPVIFVTAALLFAALAYAGAAWRFGAVIDRQKSDIDSLKERIALRDDRAAEYEKKLQGASPDQAKAEIERLTRRIEELTPPRLAKDQSRTIIAIAAKFQAEMNVIYDGTDPNGVNLAKDYAEAFQRAGWVTLLIDTHGSGGPQRLTIVAPNSNPAVNAAIDALHAASVSFDVQPGEVTTFGRVRPNLVMDLLLPLCR